MKTRRERIENSAEPLDISPVTFLPLRNDRCTAIIKMCVHQGSRRQRRRRRRHNKADDAINDVECKSFSDDDDNDDDDDDENADDDDDDDDDVLSYAPLFMLSSGVDKAEPDSQGPILRVSYL